MRLTDWQSVQLCSPGLCALMIIMTIVVITCYKKAIRFERIRSIHTLLYIFLNHQYKRTLISYNSLPCLIFLHYTYHYVTFQSVHINGQETFEKMLSH